MIYDPKDGDPDSGIAPGTPFEQIPEDGDLWRPQGELCALPARGSQGSVKRSFVSSVMAAGESIRLHLDPARHDCHRIASACEREGYRVAPIGRPPRRCAPQHKELRETLRTNQGTAWHGGLSSKASAVAREKDQISKRFNIDPAELSAQHVFDIGNASPVLRNRLLQHSTTALGLLSHGHLEQLGKAYVLDRVQIAELHRKLH